MIASVRGEVLHKGLSTVVVDVMGLGLELQATPQTLSGLHEGREARLASAYVARKDDSPLLFGFADAEEKEIFETMLGVSGIGPRTALAVLAGSPFTTNACTQEAWSRASYPSKQVAA